MNYLVTAGVGSLSSKAKGATGEPGRALVKPLTTTRSLIVKPLSIEITAGAPTNVAKSLDWAIAQGYVRCVAHVKDYELMWDRLSA
jgi:hypothetical protein